ncbi:hypothetical protein [Natronolimnobius baerhuensis]|uniref:Uncharacterized protein n=1 Tax=Natronolimnobius baerhuensis TaxID=253108 RepID=A0A202E931_9EURY|nr:hypothetical protein [Natronolimnobius baerhuensis]OVE84480.1 hypothetical protein B2G88_08720 [Natronolimnobius baerhuensis]
MADSGERRDDIVDSAHAGPSHGFDAFDMKVFVGGALLIGFAIGAVAAGGLSILDGTPPDPEIESVEIVDSGCYEDVTPYSKSSSSGVWVGVINETSTQTEVSAQIRRPSPDDATVATYRVDLETHNTSVEDDECLGRIIYRVEYDTPYPDAADAMRTERYVDGDLRGCGSSSSGPETGCGVFYEDQPTHYSNGTVTDESL